MRETKASTLFRSFRQAVLVCVLACAALPAAAQSLTRAHDLYRHTDYAASLALLDKSSDAPGTLFLIGQNYFMLGDFKHASAYFQKATAAQPDSSEYMDWLGRAYGRRAEMANPLSAPALASKARQAFEKSVELNPKNSDALSDLFDFYLNAPGFLGGGYDKALGVADRIATIDPPEGYFAKAKLAQKKKEYGTAEERLRESVAAAPHQVGHLIALAKFLANQGRTQESDAILLAAQKANPNAPQVWFARADVLIQQNRDLPEAKTLLEKYVHAPITVDDPPKEAALRLLKQVGGA
jgi:tetratricopeptide (TPR) repeat protein